MDRRFRRIIRRDSSSSSLGMGWFEPTPPPPSLGVGGGGEDSPAPSVRSSVRSSSSADEAGDFDAESAAPRSSTDLPLLSLDDRAGGRAARGRPVTPADVGSSGRSAFLRAASIHLRTASAAFQILLDISNAAALINLPTSLSSAYLTAVNDLNRFDHSLNRRRGGASQYRTNRHRRATLLPAAEEEETTDREEDRRDNAVAAEEDLRRDGA
mmetsp:Transcript_20416/g.59089  ORF Transcript_20416/g.59089 Transcript_20416/m.59089 type:complete len:212 (-) Transcript_20416:97-732(-)